MRDVRILTASIKTKESYVNICVRVDFEFIIMLLEETLET